MQKKLKVLAASLIAAVAISVVYVVPALATDEYYPPSGHCGECAQVSGPNNYIRNNEAFNLSGEGFCNAAYLYGEGKYFLIFEKCYSSGKGNLLCDGAGEFYGHGQVRRYYAMYLYNLVGRQDNYATCK